MNEMILTFDSYKMQCKEGRKNSRCPKLNN